MNAEWAIADGNAETVDLAVTNEAETQRPKSTGIIETLTRRFNLRPTDEGAHPWFLLSGLFMVVGCVLLNAAAHQRQDEIGPVLLILAVVTVYEVAVLGIGCRFVGKGRRSGEPRTAREGHQLLGLLVVMTADLTFVFNELSVADLGIGTTLAGLALVWGLTKIGIATRVAGLRLGGTAWAVVVVSLGLTFGAALVARAVGGTGRLPEWFGHAVWWPAAGLLAAGLWAFSDPRGAERAAGLHWLRGLILLVPMTSALMHVLALHWMYHFELEPAYLSPVLLGLSVVIMLRVDRSAPKTRRLAEFCGLIGAVTAMSSRDVWRLELGGLDPIAFTPFRVWLAAAVVGYAVVWWRQRTLGLLLVWPLLGGAALMGHNLGMILDRVTGMFEQVWRAMRWLAPKTLWAWGTIVVGMAFVMLGIGAWTSSRRGGTQP
ncbi:hypothetical protein [Algisphaera agarilytica]|uniref:Uncharacterized protein n=1 Tax=Algisphaera agarilytica TaxID=1385975 RepID=A0A7X0LLJ0_9BACT|nr:hypothetical protein [Algisphaera agarilytica]MBB6431565.1 hypothetical protein [Algisphaera agarilytica]